MEYPILITKIKQVNPEAFELFMNQMNLYEFDKFTKAFSLGLEDKINVTEINHNDWKGFTFLITYDKAEYKIDFYIKNGVCVTTHGGSEVRLESYKLGDTHYVKDPDMYGQNANVKEIDPLMETPLRKLIKENFSAYRLV